MDAILIKANDIASDITPKNGTDFKLDELHQAVDGFIDIIRITDNWIMVINDEGKFLCEPNLAATLVALCYGAIAPDDYVAGDVILCRSEMVK